MQGFSHDEFLQETEKKEQETLRKTEKKCHRKKVPQEKESE